MKGVRTTLTLDPEVASLLEFDRPRAPVQITPEPWDAGRVLVPNLTNVGEMLAVWDEKSEDCT